MLVMYADKNRLTVRQREPVTSGSVNVCRARFEFSPDWKGLARKAVFIGSGTQVPVVLDETGECDVPWEVLAKHGGYLFAGVYGTKDDTVLPTIRASLGIILEGVTADGEPSKPPTPELWEQELAGKGDGLSYDGLNLSLVSGEKKLSTVQIAEGGEEPAYQFGHGLKLTENTVSVDAVDDFKGDNTLPMTAAGVYSAVGNIEALLGTI